jgi:hypothetical protein
MMRDCLDAITRYHISVTAIRLVMTIRMHTAAGLHVQTGFI